MQKTKNNLYDPMIQACSWTLKHIYWMEVTQLLKKSRLWGVCSNMEDAWDMIVNEKEKF